LAPVVNNAKAVSQWKTACGAMGHG